MYGTYAKWICSDDYPWGPTREQHEAAFKAYEKHWGTPIGLKTLAPSAANEERVLNGGRTSCASPPALAPASRSIG